MRFITIDALEPQYLTDIASNQLNALPLSEAQPVQPKDILIFNDTAGHIVTVKKVSFVGTSANNRLIPVGVQIISLQRVDALENALKSYAETETLPDIADVVFVPPKPKPNSKPPQVSVVGSNSVPALPYTEEEEV